jgi:hypothetical protein
MTKVFHDEDSCFQQTRVDGTASRRCVIHVPKIDAHDADLFSTNLTAKSSLR